MAAQIVKTPLMDQYFAIKAEYPSALLLFRVGDFYETFGEDAVKASRALGIVLTKRANGSASSVELAGFPHHALETYLPKLVRAGYKVAVCDQLEDPKFAKKIVKRGITEIVTPGLSYNPQLLEASEHNFLAALYSEGEENTLKTGIAFLDISTGTVHIAEGMMPYIESLLSQYAPKELLVQKGREKSWKAREAGNLCVSTIDDWAFVHTAADEKVKSHFGVESLKGFGAEQLPLAVSAVGAALFYLELTQHAQYSHLCSIQRIDREQFMWLDRFSIRNLELFPVRDNKEKGTTLIDVIDKTKTPMGARLLRQWLVMPMRKKHDIEERHNVVACLLGNRGISGKLQDLLSAVGDMERLVSRAAAGRITPREAGQLKSGLVQASRIGALVMNTTGLDPLNDLISRLTDCSSLVSFIDRMLVRDLPNAVGKGEVIAPGNNNELDQLRYIVTHNKEYLQELQQKAAEETGISSLKISYNNVFGYYIEVRNTHKEKVPQQWIRKQTLVNAERYITAELKTYEEKILGAEERILSIEQEEFGRVVGAIQEQMRAIQQNAGILAQTDCLLGFATLAREQKYVRPVMTENDIIDISQGRHPVLETLMPPGEAYVPNDVHLDNSGQQIIILTGPNMAGKSALLRQTGLIVLLAQVGSFVPAKEASIGIVDKLFTRVGASDNIARGESTFMVEMLESAAILNNVTDRSLVLFDEIGRGTSTYDGISIAWAIAEYLHEKPGAKAKTLFATHYHELNQMADQYPRIKNFHIAVKERGQKVLFLRKMISGGVEHSFGIHVAGMAGMPRRILITAEEILRKMEAEKQTPPSPEHPRQLSFFQLEDPLLQALKRDIEAIDLNTITPLEAFDALRELKRKIGQKE